MKIGARIIKTALAVVICLFLGSFHKENSGFLSATAAIITMQSTFSDSFVKGKGRIYGTFVGALLGYIFALILHGNILLAGLGIVIIIYICKVLKWQDSTVIACVVFLIIMIESDSNILQYSIFRLLDTTSGIIIALLVNYFVLPHRPLLAVYKECNKLMEEFSEIIEKILNKRKGEIWAIHEKIITLKEKADINEYDHPSP